MANPGTLNNYKRDDITSVGGNALAFQYPVVALAYGWCALLFDGAAVLAGNKVKITMDGTTTSLTVTLNRYGRANVSLLPFIREHMASRNVQNLPLESDSTVGPLTSSVRSSFSLVILDEASTNSKTITIYYIYGNNVLEAVTDRYISLNTGDNVGSWQSLDLFGNSEDDGTPSAAWNDCNYNLTLFTFPQPYPIAIYKGGEIVNALVTYHYIEDCRVRGVRAVKWLDSTGGINVRKLTIATEQHGASVTDTYTRPHEDRNVLNGNYYHGDDRWQSLEPVTTLTLGDDSIPMSLYPWLKELVTSPVVELYSGEVDGSGVWVRCNIADSTIEKDYKKNVFTLTINLQVPTYMAQDF